jgi:hypothetical protein
MKRKNVDIDEIQQKDVRFNDIVVSSLPNEMLVMISYYLDPRSWLSWILSSRNVYNYMYNLRDEWKDKFIFYKCISAENIIKDRLKHFGLKNLPSICCENNVIIAGGFVLQALCGVSWYSDIDLFVLENDFPKLQDTITSCMSFIQVRTQAYNHLNGVVRVCDYFCKPVVDDLFQSLQLISIRSDNEMTLVKHVDSFDFSFCKCWYDGKSVQFTGNFMDILCKRGTVQPDSGTPGNLKKRTEKYTKRGFKFISQTN